MYFNSCSLYGDFVVVVVLIIKAIQLSFIWSDYKLFSSQKEVSDGRKLSRVEIAPLQIVRAKQYYWLGYFRCKSVEIESWLLHLRLVKRLKLLRNGLTCFGSNMFHILMAESPLPQAIETNEWSECLKWERVASARCMIHFFMLHVHASDCYFCSKVLLSLVWNTNLFRNFTSTFLQLTELVTRANYFWGCVCNSESPCREYLTSALN